MTTYLSEEVQRGLDAARRKALARKSRLRVVADGEAHRVLRLWDDGFALDAERAPQLRGRVDLFDGARQLYQCLVIASEEDGGERVFEFKLCATAADAAPRDYAREETAPVALIAQDKAARAHI